MTADKEDTGADDSKEGDDPAVGLAEMVSFIIKSSASIIGEPGLASVSQ